MPCSTPVTKNFLSIRTKMYFVLFVWVTPMAILAASSSSSTSNSTARGDPFSAARTIYKELRNKLQVSLPGDSNAEDYASQVNSQAIMQVINKMNSCIKLEPDFFGEKAKKHLTFHSTNGSDALHSLAESGNYFLMSTFSEYDFSHYDCPFFSYTPFEASVTPFFDILIELAALMQKGPARKLNAFVEVKKSELNLWRETLLSLIAGNKACMSTIVGNQRDFIQAMLSSLSVFSTEKSAVEGYDSLCTVANGLIELCSSVNIEVANTDRIHLHYEIQRAIKQPRAGISLENGKGTQAGTTVVQEKKPSGVRSSIARQSKSFQQQLPNSSAASAAPIRMAMRSTSAAPEEAKLQRRQRPRSMELAKAPENEPKVRLVQSKKESKGSKAPKDTNPKKAQ